MKQKQWMWSLPTHKLNLCRTFDFNIPNTHFMIHQNSSMQIYCRWFASQKKKIIGAKIIEIKMSINGVFFYFYPIHFVFLNCNFWSSGNIFMYHLCSYSLFILYQICLIKRHQSIYLSRAIPNKCVKSLFKNKIQLIVFS